MRSSRIRWFGLVFQEVSWRSPGAERGWPTPRSAFRRLRNRPATCVPGIASRRSAAKRGGASPAPATRPRLAPGRPGRPEQVGRECPDRDQGIRHSNPSTLEDGPRIGLHPRPSGLEAASLMSAHPHWPDESPPMPIEMSNQTRAVRTRQRIAPMTQASVLHGQSIEPTDRDGG